MSVEFEKLILRCLSKPQADRPKTAGEMILELEKIVVKENWTEAAARTWWSAKGSLDANKTADTPKSQSTVETTMAYDPAAK